MTAIELQKYFLTFLSTVGVFSKVLSPAAKVVKIAYCLKSKSDPVNPRMSAFFETK